MDAWPPQPRHGDRLAGFLIGACAGERVVRGTAPVRLAPDLLRAAGRMARSPGEPSAAGIGNEDPSARVLRAALAGASTASEPWLRYRMAAAAAGSAPVEGACHRVVGDALDVAVACQLAALAGALAVSMTRGSLPSLERLAPHRAIAEAGGDASDPRAGLPRMWSRPEFIGASDRWWNMCQALDAHARQRLSASRLVDFLSRHDIEPGAYGGVHVAVHAWILWGGDVEGAAAEAAAADTRAAPLAAALAGACCGHSGIRPDVAARAARWPFRRARIRGASERLAAFV